MPLGSMPNLGPPAASMPAMGGTQPQMAGPGPAMGATMNMGAGGPPPLTCHSQAQYMSNVSRPQMAAAANNIVYGPSYKMQYQRRSTADKTAVKYTGFLPLGGVYEEDTGVGGRDLVWHSAPPCADAPHRLTAPRAAARRVTAHLAPHDVSVGPDTFGLTGF